MSDTIRTISIIGAFIIAFVTFIAISSFLGGPEGKIVIQQDLKPQLDQCNMENAALKAACPKVECKSDSGSLVFYVIGILFYMVGIGSFIYLQHHNEKRSQELSERADVISKRESKCRQSELGFEQRELMISNTEAYLKREKRKLTCKAKKAK